MKLLPDSDSKILPISILALAALLIYFLGFHGFIKEHISLASEIGDQREQYQRYRVIADQREELSEKLRALQDNRQDAVYFRAESNVNAAAASMTNRLKQIITAEAEDERNCQVISNQTVRQRNQERFPKVTVNIRMRCALDDLVRILHKLEGDVPLVFIDDLNIYQSTARRSRNVADTPQKRDQDVRFNMSAYLRG